MKRLTQRLSDGHAFVFDCGRNCKQNYYYCECHTDMGHCPTIAEAYDKLADYEDLEVQCIKENECGLRMLLKKWKEFFEDIAELCEYRELEKKGLLLKLPCKVGDKLYQPTRDFVSVFEVKYVEVSAGGNLFVHTSLVSGINETGTVFTENEIGKMVFLTKEEAEKAK